MTHDDPVEELSRALAITPSPAFAARVRQQIGAQPIRGPWWSIRHLAAAAVVVCVVSATVMRWGGESAVVPVEPVGPVGPVGPVEPVEPVGPVGPVGPVEPVEPVGPVGPVEPVFAETLVPDDQRLALERLLSAIRAGRASVPGVTAEEIVDEDGRRMPRALVIEPLTLELLAGTPVK